jgi:SET domain-containing protein
MVCLFATTDIVPGTELLYNYGDREENMWWRKRKQGNVLLTIP